MWWGSFLFVFRGIVSQIHGSTVRGADLVQQKKTKSKQRSVFFRADLLRPWNDSGQVARNCSVGTDKLVQIR